MQILRWLLSPFKKGRFGAFSASSLHSGADFEYRKRQSNVFSILIFEEITFQRGVFCISQIGKAAS